VEEFMALEKVNIELSYSEALILFEFLSRFRDNEKLDIKDQSEERVLWDTLAILETKLTDPFIPDYLDLLDLVRKEVRDENF
jgi:hypothetical protein